MWPDRRRRHLAVLALSAALLGVGATGPVRAQEAPATGETLFGTYQLEARGVGVQTRYEVVGILPGGSPVLDIGVPETAARFASGPSGYGLAGLAYPGPLLADLGPLAAQSGFGSEDSIPPWPVKAEAFFPTGPTEADESQGPAVQRVVTSELGVLAQGVFPAIEAPPVVNVGSVSAATRTAIEDGAAVSRTRVALGDVSILGGLITIDSLVTDLVAAHNGGAGSTNGGTVASGVKLLGLAASLTGEGLTLETAPTGPSDPTGGALGPLVGPLEDLTAPVQDLLVGVLDQAVPQVNDLLAEAGLSISIASPVEEQTASGAAVRHSSGLSIGFSYAGKEQAALAELLNSIPPDLTPPLGPIPFPTAFLVENHIGGLSIGPGSVSALATPPFPAFEIPPIDPAVTSPTGGAVPDLGSPGFSTPPAPLPAPEPGGLVPGPTEPIASTFARAIPALLIALLILATPLLGVGSSRLADNVLAPVAAGCPHGLDDPPPPRSSPS